MFFKYVFHQIQNMNMEIYFNLNNLYRTEIETPLNMMKILN